MIDHPRSCPFAGNCPTTHCFCRHPQVAGPQPDDPSQVRWKSVPITQCETCPFPDDPDAPLPDAIDQSPLELRCVHKGQAQANAPCAGCGGNKTVPVFLCGLHGEVIERQHDKTRLVTPDNVAAEDRARQKKLAKCKTCDSCPDYWHPLYDKTAIIGVQFNPTGREDMTANLWKWWELLGPLQKITRIVHLVYDENAPVFPNEWRIPCTDRQRLFLKEPAFNWALAQLPEEVDYVVQMDTDLEMTDRHWLARGLKQLGQQRFVQCHREFVYLNSDGSVDRTCYASAERMLRGEEGHPGGTWLAQRATWEEIGGMPFCPSGGGDSIFFAAAAHERISYLAHEGFDLARPLTISDHARDEFQRYVERCGKSSVGYVPQRCKHFFHHSKWTERGYDQRFPVLKEWGAEDVQTGENGLPEFAPDCNPKFRAAIEDHLQLGDPRSRALAKMVSPNMKREGIWRGGILQVLITHSCDMACFNCTQGSNLRHKPWFMTPEQFEEIILSLKDYWGVVGVFGGNPAIHPQFDVLCEILRKHIPYEQRGLWCNNPLGKGKVMRETFNPAVSNLNVHLNQKAYDEFKRDWPDSRPFGHDTDSRHAPAGFLAIRDLDRLPNGANTEANRWELIQNCDINRYWSEIASVFRGNTRGWFCEIAAAQSIHHQHEPDYPDTGVKIEPGWWNRGMEAFAHQVDKHCHECAFPLRGYGALATDENGIEQTSATHADIYRPKRSNRKVQVVDQLVQLDIGRIQRGTDYVQNSLA